MKKVLYSDQWGEIVEYTRYRGKKGRFVSDKWGKAQRDRPYIKTEVTEWRLSKGRPVEKISRRTPDVLMKSTFPGSVDDNEGNIYDAVRDTNIFTQIDKAQTALINIRGYTEDGRAVRLQNEITIGERHQDQQLTWAVRELLAGEGYRTNYRLQLVRSPKLRRQIAKLDPLLDAQLTITLRR